MQVRTLNEQRINQLMRVVQSGRKAEFHSFEFDLGLAALKYIASIDQRDFVISALIKVCNDHDLHPKFGSEAMIQLGSLKAIEAIDMLVDALQDRYLSVNAAKALIAIGHESCVAPLAQLLKPPADVAVRRVAAETLEAIGNPIASEALAASLDEPIAYVRFAKLSALARCAGRDAAQRLIQALDDKDAEIRVEVMLWIDRLKIVDALAALEHIAKTDDGETGGEDWRPSLRVSDVARDVIRHLTQRLQIKHNER